MTQKETELIHRYMGIYIQASLVKQSWSLTWSALWFHVSDTEMFCFCLIDVEACMQTGCDTWNHPAGHPFHALHQNYIKLYRPIKYNLNE